MDSLHCRDLTEAGATPEGGACMKSEAHEERRRPRAGHKKKNEIKPLFSLGFCCIAAKTCYRAFKLSFQSKGESFERVFLFCICFAFTPNLPKTENCSVFRGFLGPYEGSAGLLESCIGWLGA